MPVKLRVRADLSESYLQTIGCLELAEDVDEKIETRSRLPSSTPVTSTGKNALMHVGKTCNIAARQIARSSRPRHGAILWPWTVMTLARNTTSRSQLLRQVRVLG
jgi:hypothetical protein